MRKTYSILILVVLCLVVLLTAGCNEEIDIQLGKLEEQVKTLRLNNARLKKEIVKTDINDAGTDLTFISLTGVLIITNNLIWWVICRRRKDEATLHQ